MLDNGIGSTRLVAFSGAARELGVTRSAVTPPGGRLKVVLERYAPTVPGFFLFYPNVARRSAPLRLFIEAAKELAVRTVN